MLTDCREARWSAVTAGWLARNPTRGGARCRVVGWWSRRVFRNMFGSNIGTVTSFPPCQSMLDMVTFMAKMWYMGSTHTVVWSEPTNSKSGCAS